MSVLSIKYESFFLNLVYSGKSLQEIVEEGASIIGTPIRFSPENKIEHAICSSGYPKEDIASIRQLLYGEGSKLRVFLSVSKQEEPDRPFFSEPPEPWDAYIFCNVIIGSHYYGNISIPQIDIDLHTVDMDMIHLISRTIALSCAVTGLWGYDISRDGLLQRILSGMVASQEELLAYQGSSMEFDGKCWKLVCVRIPGGKEPVIIRTALQRGFDGNPVVVHGRYAVMLVDVTKEDLKSRQMEGLRSVANTYGCTIGVSTAFDQIMLCREQMLCLSEHPQMIRGEAGVFDYADHKEYMLLFSSRMEKSRVLELIAGKIKAIREYDRKNSTCYFDTICAFLDCSYHVQKTAEAMHTHKNTLLYRITRIQELFGVDLRSNQDIYELNLGLSALEYWRE